MFLHQHKTRLQTAAPLHPKTLVSLTLVLHPNLQEDDVKSIVTFCHKYEMNIVRINPKLRYAKITGKVDTLNNAFGIELRGYVHEESKKSYHGYVGETKVPTELKKTTVSVLGLSNHQVAHSHAKRSTKDTKKNDDGVTHAGYYPNQVGKMYEFPPGTGKGQAIALIELGGGFRSQDVTAAFQAMKICPPVVVAVSVDGATNDPTTPKSADGEVALDIQIAGGVAPQSTVVVYFAPNSDEGFHDAILAVVEDTTFHPTIISISWGGPENEWDTNGLNALNVALETARQKNISIFVASGDGGATDGEGGSIGVVDFPASSAHVTACGGTSIQTQNGVITSEVVWNNNNGSSATGGGISDLLPVPVYQTKLKLPSPLNQGHHVGRGLPDVASVADPDTGYAVCVDGVWYLYGGTSAAAPLFAGLAALFNQLLPHPIGFFTPTLYELPSSCFRDITQGNNGLYSAGTGWDCCTGFGSPNGTAMFSALTLLAASSLNKS